jgi:hypothetical protein
VSWLSQIEAPEPADLQEVLTVATLEGHVVVGNQQFPTRKVKRLDELPEVLHSGARPRGAHERR